MKLSPKKGFTLIEVVIVLAIAALIMVIVFLGVQGAQRAQRDSKAKEQAARTLAALEQFASNSPTGSYPVSSTPVTTMAPYFAGIDPVPTFATSGSAVAGTILYGSGVKCGTNGALTTSGATAKDTAVSWFSEAGNIAGCIEN